MSILLIQQKVTIFDINKEGGNQAVAAIEKSFGPDKLIFVQVDVTNREEMSSEYINDSFFIETSKERRCNAKLKIYRGICKSK